MREIDEQSARSQINEWRTFYGCLFGALLFGVILGLLMPSFDSGFGVAFAVWSIAAGLAAFFLRMIFPKVVYVDRPVRIEVPVERIVERRVEVPIDRKVEVRVEVPVVKYVSKDTLSNDGKPSYVLSQEMDAMWRQIKVGMTRHEVISILGKPDGAPLEYCGQLIYAWDAGRVYFGLRHPPHDEFRVDLVVIPPY